MKGIVEKEFLVYNQYYNISLNKEYEILGIDYGKYYILDDNNNFVNIITDVFRITDYEIPNFWETEPSDKNRIVPKEWLYENFLFLNEGLEDFSNNEIWINTQFLKGLKKNYNIKTIPNNLVSANDNIAKEQIINSVLKSLSDFSNQFRYNGSPYLDSSFINFETMYKMERSGIYNNEGDLDFIDQMIENEKSSFKNLEYILNDLLKYPKNPNDDDDYKDNKILNRIIYSIWSIFETKKIQIYRRKYKHYPAEYILKTSEQCYKLTVFSDY